MMYMKNDLFPRRKSRVISVADVKIGGDNAISVQSMTNTPTADVEATSRQIARLAAADCDIVRLAVPDTEAAEKLPQILSASSLPIIADIHFDYRLALSAIKAGVDGLRINPGNIGGQYKVKEVAVAAKAAAIPIRIGVNAGSLEKEFLQKYGLSARAMVESALRHVAMLEKENFSDIKISLKASDLSLMIQAYRLLSDQVDYPFHIGLTEAGTVKKGSIRSACAIAILLSQGLGDTIRVSLTGDPVEEVFVAQEILGALKLRKNNFEFVSCPTCGRTMIDVERIALKVEKALEHLKPSLPLKIAVMGCVVNGPGEAKGSDLGIAGSSREGVLFYRGQAIGKYANDDLADALINKVKEIIAQQSITNQEEDR
ncbi:MAG: flavodoxin-dependent (E)-4-hydroxy-3-methylbut-2-enyl-diphosphate synthase [Bacillota bacterium]|jgi:(E)-4-hydroxy-3-methylbut-2-enyl-diphosphate synthase